MRYRLATAAALSFALAQAAMATVYNVSSIAEFRSALNQVNPGDEIRIAYGTYQVLSAHDPKHWFTRGGSVSQPIRIIGQPGPNGEKPVFDATGQAIERGVFYLWDYAPNYVFENLEIRNVRGLTYSNNAAAAYIKGDNITFRYCYSHHNDNGWFATDTAHNTVLEYCETAYNGKLPQYSSENPTHNHYMHSQGLTIRGCYIHDSTEGQNFKFRGTNVRFEYNWVQNAASYEWEIASGNLNGSSLIIGNVFIRRSGSSSRIIGLSDGTASGVQGTLTLINNTLISTRSGQPYLFSTNVVSTNLYAYNNVFAGTSTTLLSWAGSGTVSGSNNWFQQGITIPAGFTNSLSGSDAGFVNQAGKDFHLLETSPLHNAGLANPPWFNPATSLLEGRVPDMEYKALARTSLRPDNATLDIGAYEFLLAGDINRDSYVNVGDLQLLVGSWNLTPAYDIRADINGDTYINVGDLQQLVELGQVVEQFYSWTNS